MTEVLTDFEKKFEVIEGGVKAGLSHPLNEDAIKKLYDCKLINKATFIQLAIAHDFGVLHNPNLDEDQCYRFAQKWSEDISASDMRKAIDKLICATYRGDESSDPFPQLKLF